MEELIIDYKKNNSIIRSVFKIHYTHPRGFPPGPVINHVFREPLGSVNAVLSYGWCPLIKPLLSLFSIDELRKNIVINNWLFHRFEHAPHPASYYIAKSLKALPYYVRAVITFVPLSKKGSCYKAVGFKQIYITKGITVRYKRKNMHIIDRISKNTEPKRLFIKYL